MARTPRERERERDIRCHSCPHYGSILFPHKQTIILLYCFNAGPGLVMRWLHQSQPDRPDIYLDTQPLVSQSQFMARFIIIISNTLNFDNPMWLCGMRALKTQSRRLNPAMIQEEQRLSTSVITIHHVYCMNFCLNINSEVRITTNGHRYLTMNAADYPSVKHIVQETVFIILHTIIGNTSNLTHEHTAAIWKQRQRQGMSLTLTLSLERRSSCSWRRATASSSVAPTSMRSGSICWIRTRIQSLL